VVVSGDDGGVSTFRAVRVSSNWNVIFQTHSSRIEAKRGTIHLQGHKQCLNRIHAYLRPHISTRLQYLEQKMHPQRAVRRLMAYRSLLRLYRIRDAPEETSRCGQGDIRVCLPTELPKRANTETQMLG